jgi:hypothetical protein
MSNFFKEHQAFFKKHANDFVFAVIFFFLGNNMANYYWYPGLGRYVTWRGVLVAAGLMVLYFLSGWLLWPLIHRVWNRIRSKSSV